MHWLVIQAILLLCAATIVFGQAGDQYLLDTRGTVETWGHEVKKRNNTGVYARPRSWLDYQVELPAGRVRGFQLYVVQSSFLMQQLPIRFQFWRKVLMTSYDVSFQLLAETELFMLNTQVEGIVSIVTDQVIDLPRHTRLGFTIDGHSNPISFDFLLNYRQYFRSIDSAVNYPVVGDTYNFFDLPYPAIFSMSVDIDTKANGATGPQGSPDPSGQAGTTGMDVADGMLGRDGSDGMPNSKSVTQPPEPPGSSGPSGPSATAGTTGTDEADRTPNREGRHGMPGSQSVTEPSQPPGPTGAKGDHGIALPAGNQYLLDAQGTVETWGHEVKKRSNTGAYASPRSWLDYQVALPAGRVQGFQLYVIQSSSSVVRQLPIRFQFWDEVLMTSDRVNFRLLAETELLMLNTQVEGIVSIIPDRVINLPRHSRLGFTIEGRGTNPISFDFEQNYKQYFHSVDQSDDYPVVGDMYEFFNLPFPVIYSMSVDIDTQELGTTGSPGPAGPFKTTEPLGTDVANGRLGRDRSDGRPGSQSVTETSAPPGSPGPSRTYGLAGITWSDGSDGTPVSDGSDGRPGSHGMTERVDPTDSPRIAHTYVIAGITWSGGFDGTPVSDGSDGRAGSQGVTEPREPPGSPGSSGTTGPAGTTRTDGADGTPGRDESDGMPGSKRVTEPLEPPGSSGSSGPSETTKPPEMDGADGTLSMDGSDERLSSQSVTGPQEPPGPAGAEGDPGLPFPGGVIDMFSGSGDSRHCVLVIYVVIFHVLMW